MAPLMRQICPYSHLNQSVSRGGLEFGIYRQIPFAFSLWIVQFTLNSARSGSID